MSFYSAQASFSKGEITPLLATRADIDWWRSALSECVNFNVLTHGGIRRRSGTRFVAELRSSNAQGRLLPFRFSETQAYILALNNGYIRFIANRGVVETSPGNPYEIAQPWSFSELPRLSYAQANDVGYFAHGSHAPRRLVRAGETSWTLSESEFRDGPYLEPDTQGTTLTPGSRISFVPVMSDNTTPTGTVSSSPVSADAYKVFDGDPSSQVLFVGDTAGHIQYQAAAARVSDKYWITAPPEATYADLMPKAWEIQGSNDGSSWTTLDTRKGETGWISGETRYYDMPNETAYSYLRFAWSGAGSASFSDTRIAEIGFNIAGDTQFGSNLTASSTTGINDGAGFQTSDVGRMIRLLGSDGVWRWARIISRTSSTVVVVRIYGHAFPSTSPIGQWRLGSWSTATGWPAVVELFNERLCYARTDTEPVTVWGSKQGTFDDFGSSVPVVASDGLSITLLSSNMNEIIGLSADEDLMTFSAGQIRSVGPDDITKSFSAVNVTQRKGPTNGASYITPISIGGVILYVAYGGTKIRELVMGDQNRYVAPELSMLGEHMFKDGIVSWAFAEKPDPTIYAATTSGKLISITYDREQKVVGFARHDVGGMVESVSVIPGPVAGYDDLYMIVRRTINGSVGRYVEVLERPFDADTQAVEDAYHVDCGVSYDGSAITTVTGLDHLEGETVSVLADGGVVDGLTVASGQITLPYAASKIHVGLPFTSRAVTLPVAGPVNDGTLFGRRKSVTAVFADVMNTGALQVGAYGGENWTPELPEQILKAGDTMFGNAVSLKTGFERCDFESSWGQGEGKIVMESSKPLPALVRSLVLQLESEP